MIPMIFKQILLLCVLIISISSASAFGEIQIETGEYDTYSVDDVTYYHVDYEDENALVSWIVLENINPAYVSNIDISSDTYTINISMSGTFMVDVDVDLYDHVSDTAYNYSDSWLRINPLDDLQFYIGSAGGGYTGDVRGGVTVIHTLFDTQIYNGNGFILQSDSNIDLTYVRSSYEFADGDTESTFLLYDIIKAIPILGDHIVTVIEIIVSVMTAFYVGAYIILINWTFFLVVFETFVLMHATSLMQAKSSQPSSVKISKAFKAIASDHVGLFTFIVTIYTAIINMFTGAVRMIRG